MPFNSVGQGETPKLGVGKPDGLARPGGGEHVPAPAVGDGVVLGQTRPAGDGTAEAIPGGAGPEGSGLARPGGAEGWTR